MQTSRYWYSIARFVPKPANGEFANIAIVIVSDDMSDFIVRQKRNLELAHFLDRDTRLLKRVLEHLQTEILSRLKDAKGAAGEPRRGFQLLLQLHEEHRNIIQLTEPMPLIARSINAALEIVEGDRL